MREYLPWCRWLRGPRVGELTPPHFPRHTRPASSSPLTPACCLLRHLPNCSLAQGFSILAAH